MTTTTQRKLVQFVDGLNNALVLTSSNNKDVALAWERAPGSPAESLWVIETTPSGKGMKCQNYRYPMVYLEGINGVVRAVSTVSYPIPLPIALKKADTGPLRFATADGAVLKVKGDTHNRSFYMHTIANQSVDSSKTFEVKGGMSGWSVFGIVVMVLAMVGVVVAIVLLYRQNKLGDSSDGAGLNTTQTASLQDDVFQNAVFDVFAP